MKYCENAKILSQKAIAAGIFDLRLYAPQIASQAVPGQFVMAACHDRSRMLPRPISICEADPAEGWLRLVYRVAGAGTYEFSGYGKGETLELTGPLGNGFPVDILRAGGCILLFGGGIGIPPMLALAKALPGPVRVILGYRDERFLEADFREALAGKADAVVCIATEDGSAGTKGTVLDCVRDQGLSGDVLCACGPMPMLRALKEFAGQRNMKAWLSLEQRMACGVGACLGCVCESRQTDAHSQVNNKRVCADGPVFAAEEIVL